MAPAGMANTVQRLATDIAASRKKTTTGPQMKADIPAAAAAKALPA